MKILLILALSFFSIASHAGCNVYIPERVFYHDSGLTINFDFYALLKDKGYEEVADASMADHLLKIEGRELTGRFRKAQGLISMGEVRSEQTITCLTIACSIRDYAKAFQKAYGDFAKRLPDCQGDVDKKSQHGLVRI